MSPQATVLAISLVAAVVGCGSQTIPNTRVEDTSENREVIDFVEVYRQAVEQRDYAKLVKLASLEYFDDNGTPTGDDDVDYEALKAGLGRLRNEVLAARYQISYRSLTYLDQDKVLVDVLYTGWFKVPTPEGDRWRRRLSPHRIVLRREGEQYKIIAGM